MLHACTETTSLLPSLRAAPHGEKLTSVAKYMKHKHQHKHQRKHKQTTAENDRVCDAGTGVWATLQFKWVQLQYPVVVVAFEKLLLGGCLPVAATVQTWGVIAALGLAAAPFCLAPILALLYCLFAMPVPSSFAGGSRGKAIGQHCSTFALVFFARACATFACATFACVTFAEINFAFATFACATYASVSFTIGTFVCVSLQCTALLSIQRLCPTLWTGTLLCNWWAW